MNLSVNRNRPTDKESRLVITKGEGSVGGKDWEVGTGRHKLLYMGWINNKFYCVAVSLHWWLRW